MPYFVNGLHYVTVAIVDDGLNGTHSRHETFLQDLVVAVHHFSMEVIILHWYASVSSTISRVPIVP